MPPQAERKQPLYLKELQFMATFVPSRQPKGAGSPAFTPYYIYEL